MARQAIMAWRHRIAIGTLAWRIRAGLAALACLAQAPALHAVECPPTGGVEAVADTAIGAGVLRLSDGRIVKLAGISIPPAAEADARLFLTRFVQRGALKLHQITAAPDRYGRSVARLTGDAPGQGWAELALVENGLALASLYPGETDCFAALLAGETKARRLHTGFWGVDRAMSLAASNRDEVAKAVGRFAVFEGKIIRVTVRDYATFLDFGEDWRQDLSMMLPRRQRGRVEAVLGSLQALKGKSLQVRGIIEGSKPLRLKVTDADQIRVIED